MAAIASTGDDSQAGPPKYWKYEPNHRSLGHAIMRYLNATYLKRWIESPSWDRLAIKTRRGRTLPALYDLRVAARRIHTRRDIEEWHARAAALGIDPF